MRVKVIIVHTIVRTYAHDEISCDYRDKKYNNRRANYRTILTYRAFKINNVFFFFLSTSRCRYVARNT